MLKLCQNKIFQIDHKQTFAFIKAGKAAAINERRNSKAKGVAITFKKNTIYKEFANGRVEKIG